MKLNIMISAIPEHKTARFAFNYSYLLLRMSKNSTDVDTSRIPYQWDDVGAQKLYLGGIE